MNSQRKFFATLNYAIWGYHEHSQSAKECHSEVTTERNNGPGN